MDVREKASNEKRLIDADAFLKKMKRTSRYFDVVFDVEDMPTVDAVEVVRCKNCKHRYSDSWCEYVDYDDNFYCARGKRKEGVE